MSLPIVESLSGLQESILSLFRGPELNSRPKSKNWSNYIKCIDFCFIPPVWGVINYRIHSAPKQVMLVLGMTAAFLFGLHIPA